MWETSPFFLGSFQLTASIYSPPITPTTLLQTGTLQFTAIPTGGEPATLVYTWYVNDVSVSTGAPFTVVGSQYAIGSSPRVPLQMFKRHKQFFQQQCHRNRHLRVEAT